MVRKTLIIKYFMLFLNINTLVGINFLKRYVGWAKNNDETDIYTIGWFEFIISFSSYNKFKYSSYHFLTNIVIV